MIVTYLRSSSIGTYHMCEQKYYFTYVLGMKDKDNGKAIMGSVVHKNLELLGKYKIAKQNKKRTFVDEEFGKISFKDVSIDYFNDLSHEYYENNFPGIMPKNSKKISLEWTHVALNRVDGEMDPRNQEIHSVEEFFEVEVPHDWAEYSYTVGDQVIKGRLGLKGTVDLIVREGDKHFHVMDYKGLPIETPIPTPSGWTKIGDLEVGDVVFGQNGGQARVTVKSSQNIKECYQIVFDDTSKVVCDYEHRWALSDGSVVQTTELKIGDDINVAAPLDCEEVELPIDPYVLGIWLGDGRNRGGNISSGDYFLFEEIARRGFEIGENSDKTSSKCEAMTIVGLTTKLRALGMLHNKHIPMIYLRASFQQRLDLLRGLMDSDGSANATRKQCIFMNCHERLSDDVKQLLLTLGQRPLKSNTIANGFGLTVKAYPVSFRPNDINPFLLSAKADKVIGWGPGRAKRRRIRSIEPIGSKLTQCISVDSPDSTYLCTENMIPTHNTGRRYNWATEKVKSYEDLSEDKQLYLYFYALRLKYPDYQFYVSIYYINDHPIDGVNVPGGLFTFAFDEVDLIKAEQMLKKEFEAIKANNSPKVISKQCSHFKCKYMCAYSQIIPEISPDVPACIFMREHIDKYGIDATTEKYADLKKMTTYSGGGRLDVQLEPKD